VIERLGKLLRHPIGVRVCRVALGVLFVWAGLAKLGDPLSFAEQVHNFRLVPVALENLVAMTLPWIELLAGLALMTRVQARAGAATASILMAAFTLGVAIAFARGLDVECGCFGTADASRVGVLKLLENLGMLALGLVGSQRSD
jgi:uncharacterized membrane protein YphA (DoxX/SURF4 family)